MPLSTDIELINTALGRIGALPIPSLAAPGPSGEQIPNIWHGVHRDILGKYPWHCTRSYKSMTRSPDTPLRGWNYKYDLPADKLGPPLAYYESPGTFDRPFSAFELADDTVLTNATRLYCFYQHVPPVHYWPTYLAEVVQLALMAEFASAVRENWDLRKLLRRECFGEEQYQGEGGQFGVAMNYDARANPSPVIDGGRNPLTSARNWLEGDARDGYESW